MFLSHFCDNLHCAHCNIFQVTSFLIVNSTLFLMTRKHQSLGFPVCPPPSFSLQEVGSCVRNFLQRCSISYVCVSQCKLATCRIAAFLVPMITGLKLLLSYHENFQLDWTLRESVLHGDIPSIVTPELADTHYELLTLYYIIHRGQVLPFSAAFLLPCAEDSVLKRGKI